MHVVEVSASILSALLLSALAESVLHRLGHARFRGNALYAAHQEHHRLYPSSSILKPGPYASAGAARAYAPPVAVLLACLWCAAPTRLSSCVLVCTSLVFIVATDYLHTQYHVRDSWLESALGEWFLRRRRYHFVHHRDPRRHMSSGVCTVFDT